MLAILFVIAIPALIIAQNVPREMVVMEIGTGTWCQYCPGAAMGADDMLEGGYRVAVIENHNGDVFANVYSNSRNTYYGITGFPTAGFDGVSAVVGGNHTTSMLPSYLPKYNARIVVPSPIQLSMNVTHDGLNYTAVVTVHKVGTLTPANFKLHFFVTISNIQYNWQGQTHLEHVNGLMVPDQNGTPISFTSGDTQVVTLNFALDPTWPVQNVEFISFLQDATTTKEIFNSMKRGAIDLTPEFTASATAITANQVVTYTNATTGGYIGVPESYSWIFPGGTPSTSTDKDPVVTYSTAGTYDATLIVDRGSQIDTLTKPNYITVSNSVGMITLKQDNPIITPNPCHGTFKVAYNGSFDLQILDLLGKTVFEKSAGTGNSMLNTGLPGGTYFVRIKTEHNTFIEKLIIN